MKPFWYIVQYSEPVVIQTRSQSCNEINTHMEHLVQKQTISFNLKEAIWSLSKEKENRVITLVGENSKKVE